MLRFPQARKITVAVKCTCSSVVHLLNYQVKTLRILLNVNECTGRSVEGSVACVQASVQPLRGAAFYPPISTGRGASLKYGKIKNNDRQKRDLTRHQHLHFQNFKICNIQ